MPILGALNLDDGLWVTALVVCAAVGAVALWRRSREKALSLRDVERDHRARIREQARISRTLTELMEALEAAAARVNQQLDDRFATLEKLVTDADARIRTLRDAAAASPTRGVHPPAEPAPPRVARPPSRTTPLDTRSAHIPPSTSPVPPENRIIAAARAGESPSQLAAKFARPIGEIELILDLQRFSASRSSPPPPDHGAAAPGMNA